MTQPTKQSYPRVDKKCPTCGMDFSVLYSHRNRIYCSEPCSRQRRNRALSPTEEELAGGYRRISLTKGKVCLVDAEDYGYLNQWAWQASLDNGVWYAKRSSADGQTGKRTQIKMHKALLLVGRGLTVDHIDRDGLNNRRSNLRPATHSENMRNRRSFGKTSRFKGVSWCARDKRWLVQVQGNGESIKAYFGSELEAAKAHNEAALRLHGEFAHINVVD